MFQGIDEQNLAESLRFAMLGALGDVGMDGALMEPPELQAIKVRFPQLWLLGLLAAAVVFCWVDGFLLGSWVAVAWQKGWKSPVFGCEHHV